MRQAFLSLLFVAGSSVLMVQAEDLVTRDGTVYHDYKVLSHDAGYLTIMYSDGGGKIPLSNLPDDLQKKYGYDKTQAQAFVQASVVQDRQDRQAIANEQVQAQQQAAARAQAQAAAEAAAAPPASGTSPTGGVIPPNLPPPAPAPVNSPPPAAVASTATASPTQYTQADEDELKEKMKNQRSDIIDLKMQLATLTPKEMVNDHGAAKAQIDDGSRNLAAMGTQLKLMQDSLRPKKQSWDDVTAAHEQIVALMDDIAEAQHDVLGKHPGDGDGPQVIQSQLRCHDRVADDQDEIDDLRRTLRSSIKPPVILSPDDLAALKQKQADLKADMAFAAQQAQKDAGTLVMGASSHQSNEDSEQCAELNEKLDVASHPPNQASN